jgi:type VI protein secretion system component Hcp
MKKTFLLLSFLAVACLASAQSYQVFMRLTEGTNSVLPGPVPSLSGVAGSDFHAVGCTEHKMEQPGIAPVAHSPYLITYPFYPPLSPYLRQRMHLNTAFTVELFFMQDNAGTLTPYFGVRLENARLNGVTTAADSNDLQETLSFVYDRIYWLDLINNTSRGWDVANGQAL